MRYSRLIFWGFILLGFILPFLIEAVVLLIFLPNELIGNFKENYRNFSQDLLIGIMLWTWITLPFFIFSIIYNIKTKIKVPENFFVPKSSVFGLSGFGAVILIVQTFGYFDTYLSVYRIKPNYSPCVASGLGLLFLPFYTLALSPLGYLTGWLIARKKDRKNKIGTDTNFAL